MALSDAASRVEVKRPGPQCGFGRILAGLPAEDLAFFEQMRADGVPGSRIAAVFRADGHDVNQWVVQRHLRGDCTCR